MPTSLSTLPEAEEDVIQGQRNVHLGFMREALAMAELALKTNETPVGCVFVHQNTIIGRGMNATNRSYNGTRHAEFMAISSILSQKTPSGEKMYSPDILKECDLYVTVEPCIMCASLLRQFRIWKVYFGASNEKFGGTGGVLDIHRRNGRPVLNGKLVKVDGSHEVDVHGKGVKEEGDYETSGGWLREEAIVMLQRFYMQENGRAPEPKARGKERFLDKVGEDLVVEKDVGSG